MFKSLHKKNLGVRIMLGVIVGLLGVGMLLYLIPGQGTESVSAVDVVATVDTATYSPLTAINVSVTRPQSGHTVPGGPSIHASSLTQYCPVYEPL